MTIDKSSKTIPSFRNSLNLGRSFQLNSPCSGIATCIDAIDHEVLSGKRATLVLPSIPKILYTFVWMQVIHGFIVRILRMLGMKILPT